MKNNTSNCANCKKEFNEDELIYVPFFNGKVCQNCIDLRRQVLGMFAGIGGRTLI